MNIRAAEAIVNSAPKPMKIFPISEVWSQVEVSLLFDTTGAAGVAGRRIGGCQLCVGVGHRWRERG